MWLYKTGLGPLLVCSLLLSGCGEDQQQALSPAELAVEPGQGEVVPVEEVASDKLPDLEAMQQAAPASATGVVNELEWDDLIPKDFRPDDLLAAYNADELSDDDPRAAELMAKLKEMWKLAPVVKELDGQTIKLPGFVVPLEGDGQVVSSFLLVPYYGACIHVPPPPVNQTVYVRADANSVKIREMFETVWVTGKLSVQSARSDLGDAGYTLSDAKVEAYQ